MLCTKHSKRVKQTKSRLLVHRAHKAAGPPKPRHGSILQLAWVLSWLVKV